MVGLVVDEESIVDVSTDDADLEGKNVRSLVWTMAEVMDGLDDCFELDRALLSAGRIHEIGSERCETGDSEFVWFVTIAHGDLVRWNGVGSGESREAVDRCGHGSGGKVENALAFAEQVLRGVSFGAETKHAVPTQPPGRGHGSEIGCTVFVASGDENNRCAEIEDGGFDDLVHEPIMERTTKMHTPKSADKAI